MLGLIEDMNEGVSIIIVSYNVQDSLRTCLSAFLSQIDLERDEIIVIDNNSQDDSSLIIENEFKNVRLIKNLENLGYARACNQGYLLSKNPILIFSNADIIVPLGFIRRVEKKMVLMPDCGIMSPQLKTESGRIIQMCWSRDLTFFGEYLASFLSPIRVARYKFIHRLVVAKQRFGKSVPIVVGACMVLRRTMLDSIGGMDENFELYFEDADICYQCRKAGWDVYFSPDLVVYHELGKSSKLKPRKIQLIYRQSQIYFYRKNNSLLELQALKIYLFIKFVILRGIWRDKIFFEYFYKILLEKKHFRLNDINDVDL